MHLVESMAYAGEKPWHGLGNKLQPNQSIDDWKESAGMDWSIQDSEVRFITGQNGIGTISAFPEQKVLYRSDTKAPLAVVSKRFQVVQPGEILEFYRDLTEVGVEVQLRPLRERERPAQLLRHQAHHPSFPSVRATFTGRAAGWLRRPR